MELIFRMLKTLFPRGRAWRLPNYWQVMLKGMAKAIHEAKAWLSEVKKQRHPRSSEAALADWRETLGVAINHDLNMSQWQDRLEALDVAKGGQDVVYLNKILQIVYPYCWIERVPTNDILGHRDARSGLAHCAGGDLVTLDGTMVGSARFIYYIKGKALKSEERDMIDLISRLCPAHMRAIWLVKFIEKEELYVRERNSSR